MQVDFYHLASGAPEAILPRLAERVLAGGGRLLVIAADEALAARLDGALWEHAPDSFLPHGRAGGGDDARQPVLIAADFDHANKAHNVALADGTWREPALAFDRVFLLFGDDRLEEARAAWKSLVGRAEVRRRFWKQDDGGKWAQAG